MDATKLSKRDVEALEAANVCGHRVFCWAVSPNGTGLKTLTSLEQRGLLRGVGSNPSPYYQTYDITLEGRAALAAHRAATSAPNAPDG